MFNRIFLFISNILFIKDKSEYNIILQDKTDHYKKEIKELYLDKILVWAEYDEFLQKDLKNFKYRHNKKPLDDFINIYKSLYDKYLLDYKKEDIILIWTPLNIINRILKWYDHIKILLKWFNKKIGYKNLNLIKKIKRTKHQAFLNKEDRNINIKWSYKLKNKNITLIKWKTIILLDDVISTWSTANEIAKILKENWVKEVIWIFLASGK